MRIRSPPPQLKGLSRVAKAGPVNVREQGFPLAMNNYFDRIRASFICKIEVQQSLTTEIAVQNTVFYNAFNTYLTVCTTDL